MDFAFCTVTAFVFRYNTHALLLKTALSQHKILRP